MDKLLQCGIRSSQDTKYQLEPHFLGKNAVFHVVFGVPDHPGVEDFDLRKDIVFLIYFSEFFKE